MAATPFGGLGAPNMDQMAAMGIPGANMNPQVRIRTSDVYQHQHVVFKPLNHAETALSSGPVSGLPEAHAVHGSQVRTSTLSQCQLDQRPRPLFQKNLMQLFHPQVESIGSWTELKSWNEGRRLQQGDRRSHETSPRGSVAHFCGNRTRKWVISVWFWIISWSYFCSRTSCHPLPSSHSTFFFCAGKKDDKRKHSRSRSHSRRRRSGSRSRHRWGHLLVACIQKDTLHRLEMLVWQNPNLVVQFWGIEKG